MDYTITTKKVKEEKDDAGDAWESIDMDIHEDKWYIDSNHQPDASGPLKIIKQEAQFVGKDAPFDSTSSAQVVNNITNEDLTLGDQSNNITDHQESRPMDPWQKAINISFAIWMVGTFIYLGLHQPGLNPLPIRASTFRSDQAKTHEKDGVVVIVSRIRNGSAQVSGIDGEFAFRAVDRGTAQDVMAEMRSLAVITALTIIVCVVVIAIVTVQVVDRIVTDRLFRRPP